MCLSLFIRHCVRFCRGKFSWRCCSKKRDNMRSIHFCSFRWLLERLWRCDASWKFWGSFRWTIYSWQSREWWEWPSFDWHNRGCGKILTWHKYGGFYLRFPCTLYSKYYDTENVVNFSSEFVFRDMITNNKSRVLRGSSTFYGNVVLRGRDTFNARNKTSFYSGIIARESRTR